VTVAAYVAAVAVGALALASPAPVDPGFGNGGVISNASPLAIEHDGTVVAVGPQGKLFRLSPNGSRLPFKLQIHSCNLALASRSDGKLLTVCGSVLMRLKPDGSLDSGPNARVDVSDVTFSAIAVAADGTVVAAGVAADHTADLLRFLPNGIADPSFGSAGRLLLAGPAPAKGGLFVDARGRILTATGAVRRYDASGRLDETFGVSGVVTPSGFNAAALSLVPDGRILVCCGRTNVTQAGVVLASGGNTVLRLLDDGTPDSSFGTMGVSAVQANGANVGLIGLVSRSDGGAVVAGFTQGPNNAFTPIFMLVQRIASDGSLGAVGEGAGFFNPDNDCWDESADWIGAEPDSKIIVGGSACDYEKTFIIRYTAGLKRDYGPFLTLELHPGNPRVTTGKHGAEVVATVVLNHGARVTAYVRATVGTQDAVVGPHLDLLPGSRLGKTRITRAGSTISTVTVNARPTELRLLLPLKEFTPHRDYALIVEARHPHLRYKATLESIFSR
jgi:uncharacterized delta-60 repeat protein